MRVHVTHHAAVRYLQRVERMSTDNAKRVVNLARAIVEIREAMAEVDQFYLTSQQQAVVLPRFSVVLDGSKVITVLALSDGVPRVALVWNHSGRPVRDMLRAPQLEAAQ